MNTSASRPFPCNVTTFLNAATYDRCGYVRRKIVSLKRTAQVAITTVASLAALLLGDAVAAADPPDPVVVDEAAAENNSPRDDQQAQDPNCPMCDLVKAAQQLPPPDLSGWNIPP